MIRIWATVWTLVLVILLPAGRADAGISYYLHVVKGGLELLRGREPIDKLIAAPDTDPDLRERLGVALDARNFASRELGLPDNKSYRKYKDLGRPYATWTVVAAPELSLRPVEWCFPVAGCVSYRGYFSPERAAEFADDLRHQGYDIDMGGVQAYSSLGWFADPVLNTFLNLRDYDLAGLIFHELAHQKLYTKGDTAFNEAFATVVESEGIRRWLENRGSGEMFDQYRLAAEREREFVALAKTARQRLEKIYASKEVDEVQRSRKAEVLDEVRSEYQVLKQSWGGVSYYDGWFDEGLNNARLLSVGAYHDHEPALRHVLLECERDLECFFAEASRLGELSREERSQILEGLKGEQEQSDQPPGGLD